MSRLRLIAGSVADDVGFVALADVAAILIDGLDARLIGGHMVQLHVMRLGLGEELYRETQDADLGVPLTVGRDNTLVDRLLELGYVRIAGNRFGRVLDDIPIRGPGGDPGSPQAIIDILVPAYTSRSRQNRRVADNLTTTEVPGLAEAFKREPLVVDLDLLRLNDALLQASIPIPDEATTLFLKFRAWQVRAASKDAADVWRCLEVVHAAGPEELRIDELSGEFPEEIQEAVRNRNGGLTTAIVEYRGLSDQAGNELHTRMRAIVARIARS